MNSLFAFFSKILKIRLAGFHEVRKTKLSSIAALIGELSHSCLMNYIGHVVVEYSKAFLSILLSASEISSSTNLLTAF